MAYPDYPRGAYPTNTWPVYTWPVVIYTTWGFGEVYRLSAPLTRTVAGVVMLNRNVTETVHMSRTVSDTYSEIEEL